MTAREILDWWLRPWQQMGTGAIARAGRIYAFGGFMALLVTPGMILYYGADGWLWEITGSVILFAPLGMAFADTMVQRTTARRHPLVRLLSLFVGTGLGVLAGYAATLLLPRPPLADPHLLLRDYRRTMGVLSMVFAATGAIGSALWYRAETYRLKSAADAASFQVLKGQLQPHFLFNSLNSLKELIEEDPRRAGDVTQRIADLYRLILESSTRATALLENELAIVRNYCEVERVRYGDRLRYSIEATPSLLTRHVPALMLQTLVENAVKHGICKAREGGEVRVRATPIDGTRIELVVWNTGAPYAPTRSGAATGIANTRARLELMYGASSEFTIGPDEVGATCARFVVSGEALG